MKEDGLFEFSLVQYNDKNLTEKTNSSQTNRVGSQLYFKLAMENPISTLIFSIVGKKEIITVHHQWFEQKII